MRSPKAAGGEARPRMLRGLHGEGDGDQEVVVAFARVDVPAEPLVGVEGGAGLAPELVEGRT
ncbi:MAG: hypothetical protein EXR58_04795 [Chloroflexi bacterium]|nr:hypothetical protein [Chloroflexota bacterium]